MDLYEGLLSRRTIYRYEDRAVPDEAIERALEAARFAPNHKLTEPWRFHVVGKETKAQLADVAGRLARKKADGLTPDEAERQVERARNKIAKVPALVAVSYAKTPDDPFRDREDYAAVCCAVQNLMLSLWSEGIGTQWSTGGVTRDAESYRILGVPEGEEIVGFLKIGYPERVPTTRRRPLEEVVRRLP